MNSPRRGLARALLLAGGLAGASGGAGWVWWWQLDHVVVQTHDGLACGVARRAFDSKMELAGSRRPDTKAACEVLAKSLGQSTGCRSIDVESAEECARSGLDAPAAELLREASQSVYFQVWRPGSSRLVPASEMWMNAIPGLELLGQRGGIKLYSEGGESCDTAPSAEGQVLSMVAGGRSECLGFAAGPKLLVTAEHCFSERSLSPPMKVELHCNGVVRADCSAVPGFDMALCHLEKEFGTCGLTALSAQRAYEPKPPAKVQVATVNHNGRCVKWDPVPEPEKPLVWPQHKDDLIKVNLGVFSPGRGDSGGPVIANGAKGSVVGVTASAVSSELKVVPTWIPGDNLWTGAGP